MIRTLAYHQILFKTESGDLRSNFYMIKSSNNERELDIIVATHGKLNGCKAIYRDKTYDVKLIKHLQMVGIGVSQQYKYVLTRSD